MRRALLAALALVGVVLLGELALRVRGGWPGARVPADGTPLVLCVGDSLTRGRPDPEDYPAELARILVQRTGRPYRVINLGVPGMTTTQLRARFARYLDYYRPAAVLHWAGIDNAWKHPETTMPHTGLAPLAERSRLWRRVLAAVSPAPPGGLRLDQSGIEMAYSIGPYAVWRVDFGGTEEEISTVFGDPLPPDEIAATLRDDLTAMMRTARERNVPMYLIKYAFWGGYHKPVNQTIKDVSSDFGAPFIDPGAAVDTLRSKTPGLRLFDEGMHPLPPLYRQIGEDAYELLQREGVVKAAR